MPEFNTDLLEILVCPVPECRAKLEWTGKVLRCTGCRRCYKIEEGGWPNLIPEEAVPDPDAPRGA